MNLKELYSLEKLEREYVQTGTALDDDLIFEDDEFKLLDALYGKQKSRKAVEVGHLKFSTEALGSIRKFLEPYDFDTDVIPDELPYPKQLSAEQVELLSGIVDKMRDVEEVWEFEDDDRWEFDEAIQSVGVLYMMDEIDRDFSDDAPADDRTRLTDDESAFLSAIYNDTPQSKGGKFGKVSFNENELDYVRIVLSGTDLVDEVELSANQENFIKGILQKCRYLNEEEEDLPVGDLGDFDEEDSMPLDIEVLYMMDELEREEMKAIGEKDGDLLFNDDQYSLLRAVFAVMPPEGGVSIGLTNLDFSLEELRYLGKLFKFEVDTDKDQIKKRLSEEQLSFVLGILTRVKELQDDASPSETL